MALDEKERARYIKEVESWLLYRDMHINTWWSDSQKALLEEIYALRAQLKRLKEKGVNENNKTKNGKLDTRGN